MRLCWEKKWKHIHAVKMQLGMPMPFTGCLFGISPNNVGQITKLHARNPGRCCQHWGYTSPVREHHDIFTGNHRELHILTVVADLWNKRQCIIIQLGSFCVWAQPMRGDASNEAGGRQTHRRGCRMDAQWSASSRHVITIYAPPLGDGQRRTLNDDCGDHWASIRRSRPLLSHHGDGSAFVLPLLCDLLCLPGLTINKGLFQGRHKGRWSSYTETRFSVFRRPLSVPVIFLVATVVPPLCDYKSGQVATGGLPCASSRRPTACNERWLL